MNWLLIKHFGKVKYFNISYAAILIIPILKEIIEKVNHDIGHEAYFLPYTIRMLYGASLCYALGIAIYQFFCPSIMKAYDKVQDYIRDNMQIYLTAYPDLKLQIIRTNLTQTQNEARKKLESLVLDDTEHSRLQLEKQIELLLPSCVQRSLTNEFNTANEEKKLLIFLSGLFYLLGTLIVVFLLFRKSYLVLFT